VHNYVFVAVSYSFVILVTVEEGDDLKHDGRRW